MLPLALPAAQGGGTAAKAALERAEEALRALRISVNPSLAAANYVFLPQPSAAAGDTSKVSKGAGGDTATTTPADMGRSRDMPATQAARGARGGGRGGRGKRREARPAGVPARLQHDGGRMPGAAYAPLLAGHAGALAHYMHVLWPCRSLVIGVPSSVPVRPRAAAVPEARAVLCVLCRPLPLGPGDGN